MGVTTFAQNMVKLPAGQTGEKNLSFQALIKPESNMRTTGNGDTLLLANFPSNQEDSLAAYRADNAPFDSGYVAGMNAFGDKGFAERYDISSADSSVRVLGMIAIFTGNYTPSTTKTINLKVWRQGPRAALAPNRPKVIYNGFPGTQVATMSVSIKNLGISLTGPDSFKTFVYPSPTAPIGDSFFVGYDISYNPTAMAGDTISLLTTRANKRYAPILYMQGTDTIINVKNATQFSDNSWSDNAIGNFQIAHHYVIYPIVTVQVPSGIGSGISKNDLTFYGNFPNPASDKTTVKFSLKNPASVTITLTDMSGRTIRTIDAGKLSAGLQNIPVSTADLAAGNYIYVIRTSEGDGIGAQLSVLK